MKKAISYLVFAGTSEGRQLAEFFQKNQIPALFCVATAYGEELLEQTEEIRVHTGRMDEIQMQACILELMKTGLQAVIDATHPHAVDVTENLKRACEAAGARYIRLLRKPLDLSAYDHIVTVKSCQEAADWLEAQQGNIFLTTGLKELPEIAAQITDKKRLYARVLPQEEAFAVAEGIGLQKKQLICMQGPFSRELNAAMLRETKADFLVTKESGAAGGFADKVQAAGDVKATCVVIIRPMQESGYSLEEVETMILQEYHKKQKEHSVTGTKPEITLLGIGMGAPESMTLEGFCACRDADCIIGAKRMLEAVKNSLAHWSVSRNCPELQKENRTDIAGMAANGACDGKTMVSMYESKQIADYIRNHPTYSRIVIALSGDVGFYSGAKKLQAVLAEDADFSVRVEPGISSLVYFCAKIGVSWEDAAFVSLHGQHCNFLETVRRNRKTLAIAGGKGSVREICQTLSSYGWEQIVLYVGTDLSYPEEQIVTGTPFELAKMEFAPLAVLLFENPNPEPEFTAGMADEVFLRDKVPMTKREVRNASLSHLQLSSNSVVYDIGSGTGSVSIEMALRAAQGKVYAIEKNPAAVALLQENKKKFAVDHLEIIEGTAPEALEALPVPTHAFIGGSAGNLKEILELLLRKNPNIRVVLNTVTVETLAEAASCFKKLAFEEPEIVCLQASNAKKAGRSHLMIAQNPVYIFTAQGGAKE